MVFPTLFVIIYLKVNIFSITCSDLQSNHEGQADKSSAVGFLRCSEHRAERTPEGGRAACVSSSILRMFIEVKVKKLR